MRLVEKTEAHVVIGLLLLLSLLLLSGRVSGTASGGTTGSGGGSATSTTRGNGSKLLRAGSDQLRKVSLCQAMSSIGDAMKFRRIPR